MSLDEETLQRVAEDGEMNYDKWPDIVEPFLERIDHIVYYEFSIPQPYPNIHHSRETISPQQSQLPLDPLQSQSPTSNGATIPATPTPTRNLPPVPLFPSSASSDTPTTSQIPESLPPATQPSSDGQRELPQPLSQILIGITKTLRTSFSALPPHTIQRLAELVLYPTKHYRTLPAWLRAVDRVVSVTSSADIFPLPRAMPLPSHVIDSSLLSNGVHGEADKSVLGQGGGGILWLNDTGDDWNSDDKTLLGSDESLGGALLTPIPWLRNGVPGGSGSEESGDLDSRGSDDLLGDPIQLPVSSLAANGNSMVPEREDGAVTQGELIRQEQEAGVVPVGHSSADNLGMMMDDEDDSDEEIPHARGPEMMGAVDVGMVDGRGMEVNVGTHSGRSEAVEVGRGVRDAQEVLVGGDIGRGHRAENAVGEDVMVVDEENGIVTSVSSQTPDGASGQSGDSAMDEDTEITDATDALEEDGKVSQLKLEKT